jgi:hypothetical protein
VLGPKFFAAAALRGSNSVGPTINSGALASAALINVRRVTGRDRVPAIDWPAVVSRSLGSSFFFIRSSSDKFDGHVCAPRVNEQLRPDEVLVNPFSPRSLYVWDNICYGWCSS